MTYAKTRNNALGTHGAGGKLSMRAATRLQGYKIAILRNMIHQLLKTIMKNNEFEMQNRKPPKFPNAQRRNSKNRNRQ